MSETLEGQLERIVYFNDESLYTVAKLKVKGLRELVTVVGKLTGITPGEVLKLSGAWEIHPKYGQQFKVSRWSVSFPSEVQGIERYLGSGLIRGIGPEMAKRLVTRFGDKTLEVMEHRLEAFLDVPGFV
jgi:exodeoxyribonuclease V alpha subunit